MKFSQQWNLGSKPHEYGDACGCRSCYGRSHHVLFGKTLEQTDWKQLLPFTADFMMMAGSPEPLPKRKKKKG